MLRVNGGYRAFIESSSDNKRTNPRHSKDIIKEIMIENIDFREKYISSLEEQKHMFKKQQNIHQSLVGKLQNRIRDLESQLSESRKRKESDSDRLTRPSRGPGYGLSVYTASPSRPIIRGSLSLPASTIGEDLNRSTFVKIPVSGPPIFRAPSISDGRTLPPFYPIRVPADFSTPQQIRSKSFNSYPPRHTASEQQHISPPFNEDDGPACGILIILSQSLIDRT